MVLEEIWKEVPGVGGGFFASNFGRIRSIDTEVPTTGCRRPGRGEGPNTRICKGRLLTCRSLSRKGYCRINLKGTIYLWHRIIAITFLDNPEGKPQVNHKDGDKTNNRADNLEWCTNMENRTHAVENGLQAVGEKSGNNILKEIEVLSIVEQLILGVPLVTLARRYNVSSTTIRDIRDRKTWRHLSTRMGGKNRLECKNIS